MKTIDIIIPIKGRPDLLTKRSLPSLVAQAFKGFKVTIVDDGSSQEDFQTIQKAVTKFREKGLDVTIEKNQGAPGAAGARNYGLSITNCKYVLWFDSDDILLPNKLEVSLKLLEVNDYNFAITRAQHIRNGELINEFWGEPQAPNRGKYEYHFPFQTMCALYKRSFLETARIRWNENTNVMDDWEISNLVLLSTDQWVYSPEVTAHYFVPTVSSGSIGSQLTKAKVKSQLLALEEIMTVIESKGLRYSFLSRLKVCRHKAFLKFRV